MPHQDVGYHSSPYIFLCILCEYPSLLGNDCQMDSRCSSLGIKFSVNFLLGCQTRM